MWAIGSVEFLHSWLRGEKIFDCLHFILKTVASRVQVDDVTTAMILAVIMWTFAEAKPFVALLQLAEHAAGHRRTAPEDLLERLSVTLGKMLIPMLSTPQPNGAEKKAQEAAAGIKNAIASLTSATLAIERWKMSRPEPGSNHPGAIVWEMQLVAKEIFQETHKRPTKRQIRWELEQDGWGIKSKVAEARWAERFRRAGLAGLPDWAPP